MSDPSKEITRLKAAGFQIASGGMAGFTEVLAMDPLDVVKTRLQLQTKTEIYQQEGFGGFYKGIIPPLIAETPKRAMKFLSFEQLKPIFMFGQPKPNWLTYALSGLTTGLCEGFVVNPFEVVKVVQQADRARHTESFPVVTRKIIATDGFGRKGLYRGLSATSVRNGMFNGAYFCNYYTIMGYFPPTKEPFKDFVTRFVVGLFASAVACIANTPIDVVKSRIQAPQPPGAIKYKSLIPSTILIYKEEGALALYKGLVPRVMRVGPGGAIMLVVYEYSYAFLVKNFT